eukprot:GILK01002755.1.p1 GENE.GILK01002755.1~~GILK01002755.1.p1  ORF type:complete len:277 (+),score=47.68 GILK01002755.1:48-878(+)
MLRRVRVTSVFSSRSVRLFSAASESDGRNAGLASGAVASWPLRRFYKKVDIKHEPTGYSVLLDGRSLKTPKRLPLIVPTEPLALAVADEWNSQDTTIKPFTMPLMSFCSSSLDQTPHNRSFILHSLLRYLGTDTTCYRAESPSSLVSRQADHWDPLLRWFETHYNAPLIAVTDIIPKEQPAESTQRIRSLLENMSDWRLTGVEHLTASCKSLVIALAVAEGHVTVEQAVRAARVEEDHQVQEWGEVKGGHDIDESNTLLSVASAKVFISLAELEKL